MLQHIVATQCHQRLHLVFMQWLVVFGDAVREGREGIFGKAGFHGFCTHLFRKTGMTVPELLPQHQRPFLLLHRGQQAIHA